MADENKPYRGMMAEQDELRASMRIRRDPGEPYSTGLLDRKEHFDPRMKPYPGTIFHPEVPIRHLILWYLKIGIPALVFVALATAVCYLTVSFLMTLDIKNAARELERSSSNWRAR